MIVLVFGGRLYKDRATVFAELDKIHAETPISQIIHGGAQGADRFGQQWARTRGVSEVEFRADWDNLHAEIVRAKKRPDGSFYNSAAGNNRNLLMMAKGRPDIALEFPGGAGTASMRRIVRAEMKRRELRHVRVK